MIKTSFERIFVCLCLDRQEPFGIETIAAHPGGVQSHADVLPARKKIGEADPHVWPHRFSGGAPFLPSIRPCLKQNNN